MTTTPMSSFRILREDLPFPFSFYFLSIDVASSGVTIISKHSFEENSIVYIYHIISNYAIFYQPYRPAPQIEIHCYLFDFLNFPRYLSSRNTLLLHIFLVIRFFLLLFYYRVDEGGPDRFVSFLLFIRTLDA